MKAELKTKTQWRRGGRGIKPKQDPAEFRTTGGRSYPLYSEDQTIRQRPYTVARNYLLDLFANYPPSFGYTPQNGDQVYRVQSSWLLGGAYAYLERGFNYKACKKGIQIGRHLAQGFHIGAGDTTRFAVIDLDNHTPTRQSTEAHLRLLTALQDNLGGLIRTTGAVSSFFQYRQIEPSGIQLWLVTPEMNRDLLHTRIRNFLLRLDRNGLNDSLKTNGLATLANIEILPGKRLVSMPGIYGKNVFTAEELRISDQRFDCEALHSHIATHAHAGDVLQRYSALALVQEYFDHSVPLPIRSSIIQENVPSHTAGKHFWSDLKFIALNGVCSPDNLHDGYLEPLAYALLLREFHEFSDKSQRTFHTISDWVSKKHNNCISRLSTNRKDLVDDQIQRTIRAILKKPNKKIADFYTQMRANDQRFPHRIEHLIPLLEAPQDAPPFLLIDCKGCSSDPVIKCNATGNTAVSTRFKLGKKVAKRIDSYALKNIRTKAAKQGFRTFAKKLVSVIGPDGSREINSSVLFGLAGRKDGSDPSFLKRWKKHLVAAKILKKGWEKNIVRGVRSSRYSLMDWVIPELQAANPSRRPP